MKKLYFVKCILHEIENSSGCIGKNFEGLIEFDFDYNASLEKKYKDLKFEILHSFDIYFSSSIYNVSQWIDSIELKSVNLLN